MTTEKVCILKELNIQKYESLEALVKDLNGCYVQEKHPIQQLEEEHTDFSFFADTNLSELTDMLLESGIDRDEIIQFNSGQDGPIIDFFEIQNGNPDNCYYMMGVGHK